MSFRLSASSLVLAVSLGFTDPLMAQGIDRPVRDPDGFRRAVAAARPGDRILLAPGDYPGNYYLSNVHGAANRPIVITAADPNRPPRFVGRTICLQFSGASYLELHNLVLTGSTDNALNIDDGDRPDRPAHHITLKNLRISRVGPQGNVDGIKLSGVDDATVTDCTIEQWGSGGSAIDMVGCHRVTIRGCTFRNGGSNGVQAKGGSADVVITGCRFENSGERGVNLGGSTSVASFRPPLDKVPAGMRSELKNGRVEGCVFVGGRAAVAVVGADAVTVRFNTIYRPEVYALRILQENTGGGFVPCRDGVFTNNVIVFQSAKWGGVNIGPDTAPRTFWFADNLWFCEDRPARSAPELPVAEVGGIVGRDPLFRDPGKGDFGIMPGSPAADRGAHALPRR